MKPTTKRTRAAKVSAAKSAPSTQSSSWKYAFKVDVRNEGDGPAEMTISGPIGYSFWDDSGTSARTFCEALAKIPNDKRVRIKINSEGGSVQDGLEMFNAIKERGNVTTY